MNAAPLCLGNVPKDFSAKNLKKTGLYGYDHDFTVDYDSFDAAMIVLMLLIFQIFLNI